MRDACDVVVCMSDVWDVCHGLCSHCADDVEGWERGLVLHLCSVPVPSCM